MRGRQQSRISLSCFRLTHKDLCVYYKAGVFRFDCFTVYILVRIFVDQSPAVLFKIQETILHALKVMLVIKG